MKERRAGASWLIVAAGGAVALGCAAAPAGPRGPMTAAGIGLAGDMSVAAGNARLKQSDGTTIRDSADYYYDFNVPV